MKHNNKKLFRNKNPLSKYQCLDKGYLNFQLILTAIPDHHQDLW